MMNKKALILVALLLPASTWAQEETDRPADRTAKMEQRTADMVQQLGLTDEQAAKLKELNARYAEEMKAARPSEAEREAQRQKMKSIRDRRDAELKTLLTGEQYARMVELRTEQRAKHKNKPSRK